MELKPYYEGLLGVLGIYPAEVIRRELGQIPKTAFRIALPAGLEKSVGEFYRLYGADLQLIREPDSSAERAILGCTREGRIAQRKWSCYM